MALPSLVKAVLEQPGQWERLMSNRVKPEMRQRFFRALARALRRGDIDWSDSRLRPSIRNRFLEYRASHAAKSRSPLRALDQIPAIRSEVLFEYSKMILGQYGAYDTLTSLGLLSEVEASLADGVQRGEVNWRTLERIADSRLLLAVTKRVKARVLSGALSLGTLKPRSAASLRHSLLLDLASGALSWEALGALNELERERLLAAVAQNTARSGRVPVFNWAESESLRRELPFAVAQALTKSSRTRMQSAPEPFDPELESRLVPILGQRAATGKLTDSAYRALERRSTVMSQEVLWNAAKLSLDLELEWPSRQNGTVLVRRGVLQHIARMHHEYRRAQLTQVLRFDEGELAYLAGKALAANTDALVRDHLYNRLLVTNEARGARDLVGLLSQFEESSVLLRRLAAEGRSELVRASAITRLIETRDDGVLPLLWQRLEVERSKRVLVALLDGFGELGGAAEAKLLLAQIQKRQREAEKVATRQALRKIAGHSPQYVAEAAEAALIGGLRRQARRLRRPLRRLVPVLNVAARLAHEIIDPILRFDPEAGLQECAVALGDLSELIARRDTSLHQADWNALPDATPQLLNVGDRLEIQDLVKVLTEGSRIFQDGVAELARNSPIQSNELGGVALTRLINQLGARVVHFLVLVWGFLQLRLIPPLEDTPAGLHLVHAT